MTVRVESEYIPDTVLHPLNGEYVVSVTVPKGFAWLSPDEADLIADQIKKCAASVRIDRGSVSLDDES